jgi:hypothetical protein
MYAFLLSTIQRKSVHAAASEWFKSSVINGLATFGNFINVRREYAGSKLMAGVLNPPLLKSVELNIPLGTETHKDH